MFPIKSLFLAAIAAAAFTTPSVAQNFQGMGAPSYVTEGNTQSTQNKPVMLKTHKVAKPHRRAEK
jgi:hypothetical protein